MDEPWTQSSMQSSDTGRGAGKTRQEEMDVEEKRNVNIIVHYYTIIHISRFFKAKKKNRSASKHESGTTFTRRPFLIVAFCSKHRFK